MGLGYKQSGLDMKVGIGRKLVCRNQICFRIHRFEAYLSISNIMGWKLVDSWILLLVSSRVFLIHKKSETYWIILVASLMPPTLSMFCSPLGIEVLLPSPQVRDQVLRGMCALCAPDLLGIVLDCNSPASWSQGWRGPWKIVHFWLVLAPFCEPVGFTSEAWGPIVG